MVYRAKYCKEDFINYNKGFNDCLKLTIEAFECLETHNFRVWLDEMNK